MRILSGRSIVAHPWTYVRRWEMKNCGQGQSLVWLKHDRANIVPGLSMILVHYLLFPLSF